MSRPREATSVQTNIYFRLFLNFFKLEDLCNYSNLECKHVASKPISFKSSENK